MFIPIQITTIVLGLAGVAWWRSKRPGVMTTERDRIYRAAIGGSLKDPHALRKLADAFEKEKLYPQALLLRQRAALRELPDDVKAKRRLVWRQAMRSKNKLAVLRLADAYEKEGCTTACARLRAYASGLPEMGMTPAPEPVVTPPPVDVVDIASADVSTDPVVAAATEVISDVKQAAE